MSVVTKLPGTFVFPGVESLSVCLPASSTWSSIQAIFVRTLLFSLSAFAVTLHCISIVSEFSTNFPSSYAGKLVPFPSFLFNVNLFVVSL